jgi:uncharacterized phage protein (TIGR02218 family)
MRIIDPSLQGRLDTGSSTLCRIFTITTAAGAVLRWTDLDIDIEYNGDTYLATRSLKVSNVSTSVNGGVNSTNVEFFYDDAGITRDDILKGEYDSAVLSMSWIDWTFPEYGEVLVFVGEVSVTQATNKFRGGFEATGILNRGDMRIGQFYTPECSADLGDARCGKDTALLTTTGTILSTATRLRFLATMTAPENDYFSFGVLTWDTGPNAGRSIEVLSQLEVSGSQQIVLALEMPVDPGVGDTFTILAGCDKRRDTCKTKFDNIVNYRGYPFVPGTDTITDRLIR